MYEMTGPKLWEAVAVAAVAQAAGVGVDWGDQEDSVVRFLKELAPEPTQGERIAPWGILDRLYRAIDESKVDEPYPVALARELKVIPRTSSYRIKFSQEFDNPVEKNAIILAPFGVKAGLELPMIVWRHIARYVRSYGCPVYLLGDRTSRLDIGTFTEGDHLGRQPFPVIMSTIAHSLLVVGVANEWTWLTASLDKRQAILYPDNLPQLRWFWYPSKKIGRIIFTASQVQTPVVLTGLRKFMAML
jgi:hypothetical protein